MKTAAFTIRIAICLLLSLIPVTELENRIYSARIEMRGHGDKTPRIVLIELDPRLDHDPQAVQAIKNEIQNRQPALLLESQGQHRNHLLIDSDGVVRRAVLQSKGQPSLTFLAYRKFHGNTEPFKKPSESHLINYVGPADTFPQCTLSSAQSISECKDLPSFKDKIILLIQNGGNFPTFHTPIGEMRPIEILANDLQTIVFHQPIHQVPFIGRLIITLGMILLGAFYILYYPVLMSAIAITGTGVVIVVFLFQALFTFLSIYIPSANIICSLLITYLIFTGYRLAIQENLQWRALKQAQYLRELDHMKTNFLSLVSHDLKTPLAKIQAMAERMRRELNLPAEQRSDWREFIDSIENSNNEMKRFITSILNLSKIESQKVILNKKSNDINQLIEQALKRLRPLALQRNIRIDPSLDPLFSIECDEDLMRQVLTNLIDNAIKYSPPDSRVIVRSREEEGFVRVEVEDFGPGIPKDQLPLMFRKFSRFLRPTQEQVKGTGLGLYLSKYFIELHGGTIRVKSIEGQGTTFTFTLPLQGAENEAILG